MSRSACNKSTILEFLASLSKTASRHLNSHPTECWNSCPSMISVRSFCNSSSFSLKVSLQVWSWSSNCSQSSSLALLLAKAASATLRCSVWPYKSSFNLFTSSSLQFNCLRRSCTVSSRSSSNSRAAQSWSLARALWPLPSFCKRDRSLSSTLVNSAFTW